METMTFKFSDVSFAKFAQELENNVWLPRF